MYAVRLSIIGAFIWGSAHVHRLGNVFFVSPHTTHTLAQLLAISTMSSSVQASSSSTPNFQPIFEKALKEYKKKTGRDLIAHPLVLRLKAVILLKLSSLYFKGKPMS